MTSSWLSLLPPLVVLVAAFFTHHLNSSLILGLVLAGVIACDGSGIQGSLLACKRLSEKIIDADTLYLYCFLLLIGCLIMILNATGGAYAFARKVTKHLKNARGVEIASLLVSAALFIDDYLSNLTVGCIIRPLADRFSIARVKLAFLIHSLSGPLVILVPISSWIGMITRELENAGVQAGLDAMYINADPFMVYLQTLPFIFYSWFMVITTWFIVLRSISFGPMHTHEHIAVTTGNLIGGKEERHTQLVEPHTTNATLADLVIPIATLTLGVIGGMLYSGGFWLLGGNNSFMYALQRSGSTQLILLLAALAACIIALSSAWYKKQITRVADIMTIAYSGMLLMLPALIMLALASTLGEMLKVDLLTGRYVASTLISSVGVVWLPFMFFLVAALTALVTGTSWGTIALLTPLAVQTLMAVYEGTLPTTVVHVPLILPLIGAVFSGAVCGDHLSPLSETTIMASTSSGAYPFDHAQTQFLYGVPVVLGCAWSTWCVSALMPHGMVYAIGIAGSTGLLLCLGLVTLFNKNRHLPQKG